MEYFQAWDLAKHLNTFPSANTTRNRGSSGRKEGPYFHQHYTLRSEYHKAITTDRWPA
jgi:hypothetical protein